MMHPIDDINILECPVCGGLGLMQEENGWCFYVSCLDCGSHTAELSYRSAAERPRVAQQVADLWNMGKIIRSGLGE